MGICQFVVSVTRELRQMRSSIGSFQQKLITEAFTEMRITRGGKVINFDVFKKVDVGVSVSWMSTFRFDFLKRFNTS